MGCTDGCATDGLSRRALLVGVGALGVTAAGAAVAPQMAFAASPAPGDVLVSIFLRGGMDGLAAVVPYTSRDYQLARPTVRIPADKVLRLDGRFGLHPALRPLHNIYRAGDLAVVNAVGSRVSTHSHFDAQEWMDRGTPGSKSTSTGWIGRHLATRPGQSMFRAVAIGSAVQASLRGPTAAIALRAIGEFRVSAADKERTTVETTLDRLYAGLNHQLGQQGRTTVTAVRRLAALSRSAYVPANGAKYPDTELARQLSEVARLIRARVGLEAVTLDAHGWDTHATMGSYRDGVLEQKFSELAAALGAFYRDLGALRGVTVLVHSEFGRKVQENGSGGTEHGNGNAMFVLGGGVRGGVYGAWPGITAKQRLAGDVRPTTDYRSVFAEVLHQRLLNRRLGQVFPGFRPQFLGLAHPR